MSVLGGVPLAGFGQRHRARQGGVGATEFTANLSADISIPCPLFVRNLDPDYNGPLAILPCVDEHKHRMMGFSRQPIPVSPEKPASPCRGGTLRKVHMERMTRR
jgi:hypothetical protein